MNMRRMIGQSLSITFAIIFVTPCHAQNGCQSQGRISEILETAKTKGLQPEDFDVVLLPELRDSFISLHQTSPDLPLLGSMCFYALRKETYAFNGSEMPNATVDLQDTSPEWYLASSPRKVYALKGFRGATQEFSRMMRELRATIDSADDAEAAFDLYVRSVRGEDFRSQIVGDELKLVAVAANDFRVRYPAAKRDEAFRQWLNNKRRQHVPLHPPKALKKGDMYAVSYFGYMAGDVIQSVVVMDRHGTVEENP